MLAPSFVIPRLSPKSPVASRTISLSFRTHAFAQLLDDMCYNFEFETSTIERGAFVFRARPGDRFRTDSEHLALRPDAPSSAVDLHCPMPD
eukprot:1548112-Heterocapsa_arctica.AAC.1